MAEVHKTYYTKYKAGEDAYVEFGWEIMQYGDTLYGIALCDKAVNIDGCFIIEDTVRRTDSYPIQVISMSVTGSGRTYDNNLDYTIVSCTCEDVDLNYNFSYPSIIPDTQPAINVQGDYLPGFINNYDISVCIESIFLSDSITHIGQSLFHYIWDMNNFESKVYFSLAKYLHISNNVKSIGDMSETPSAGYLSEGSLSTIGNVLFDVSKLESAGYRTFSNNVEIYNNFDNLKELGNDAFYKYNCVSRLNIPKDLNYLGRSAFRQCLNLIDINENNYINCACNGTVFSNCTKIEKITLGDDTTQTRVYAGYYNAFIYLELNTGSNCDENGYQQVEVITNIDEFKTEKYLVSGTEGSWNAKYLGTGWLENNVKIDSLVIVTGTGLIHIQAGLNKVITIKSYADGEITLAVGNELKRVKLVKITDASASDIHIAVNNRVKALKK